jgi:hypothetical protein
MGVVCRFVTHRPWVDPISQRPRPRPVEPGDCAELQRQAKAPFPGSRTWQRGLDIASGAAK